MGETSNDVPCKSRDAARPAVIRILEKDKITAITIPENASGDNLGGSGPQRRVDNNKGSRDRDNRRRTPEQVSQSVVKTTF
ncbi:hypothetical protein J6590_012860 [Homalodisca vitripennis]|nr:hypothetical protein J6590_012860 [Homalodisca vitripennis]